MSKISVSKAVALLQCPRQGWMANHRDFEWLTLPKNEAQLLGSISHKIAEEIDEGKFDHITDADLTQSVLSRWNDLVEATRSQMGSQSIFGLPAQPSRWPYFVVKQSHAMDRALLRRANRGNGHGFRRPDVEVFVESDSLELVGRIDKIEYLGPEVRLVDLKTAENPGGPIPRIYKNQLMLYAAIWWKETGKLPVAVAVEWQNGSRSTEKIFEEEVAAICIELTTTRAYLDSPVSPSGNPSEETCRYCDFRVSCSEYQVTERTSWIRHPSFVAGLVEKIVDLANERVLVLQTTSSHPYGLEKAVLHKFPVTEVIEIGDYVVFDRVTWRGGEGNFDALWNSRFKKFGDETP